MSVKEDIYHIKPASFTMLSLNYHVKQLSLSF